MTQPAAAPDRVARSLRSAELRALYAGWRARRRLGGLPGVAALDFEAMAVADHVAVAAIEPGSDPMMFRLVRAGRVLEQRAGRSLVGERIGDATDRDVGDPIGGAGWAYRQCAASGTPSYEFAHFDFGDEQPLLFERLLLPCGGFGRPTHIIAASLFSEAGQD